MIIGGYHVLHRIAHPRNKHTYKVNHQQRHFQLTLVLIEDETMMRRLLKRCQKYVGINHPNIQRIERVEEI